MKLSKLSMTQLLRTKTELERELELRFERPLALAFSETVGSAPYFKKFGDQAGRQLQQRHFDLLEACLSSGIGRLIDTTGDTAFLTFPSVHQAIAVLTEFRKAAALENASSPLEHQMQVRIGVHWSPVFTDGVTVSGDAVSLCGLVAGTAGAGEIRITGEALRALPVHLNHLRTRPLGAVALGAGLRPVELFAYEWRDQSLYPTHVRIEEMSQEIELPELDAITFGRNGELDGADGAKNIAVSLPLPELASRLSQCHFELRRFPDGFRLRALSETPIEVDGNLLRKGEETPIRPGSRVRVATVVTLTYFTPDSAGVPAEA